MDGLGLFCFSCILWFCTGVDALPCSNKAGIYYHGKKSNTGEVLKRVNGTGPHQCLQNCRITGKCYHINYNRCLLECDLMTLDCMSTELEFTSDICMTYLSLPKDTEVSVPNGKKHISDLVPFNNSQYIA